MRLPSPRRRASRMAAAREIVEEALRSEAAVYGLTTALAERKSVVLDAGARQGFSRFLIRGHLIAQGPPAPPPVVRAAMVCLVNGFAKGVAGVRPELAEMLIGALNRGLVPAVRSLGSVGQADLGPTGRPRGGPAERDRLRARGQRGAGAGQQQRLLHRLGRAGGARRRTAAGGSRRRRGPRPRGVRGQPQHSPSAWSPRSGRTRAPSRRSAASARCSPGARSSEPGNARNLQDPLTFRSIPQILGAARDALGYVRTTIETELNSAGAIPPSSWPNGASCRSATSTSCRSPPRSTLPASPWPRW